MSGKVLLIGSESDTRTTLAQRLRDALFDVCEHGINFSDDLNLYDCVIVIMRNTDDIDILGSNFKTQQFPTMAVLDREYNGSPSTVLGTLAQDVLSPPCYKANFWPVSAA